MQPLPTFNTLSYLKLIARERREYYEESFGHQNQLKNKENYHKTYPRPVKLARNGDVERWEMKVL